MIIKIKLLLLVFGFLAAVLADCNPSKKINSKLICYYSKLTDIDNCQCSHVILPANSDVKAIDGVRDALKGVKILISVNEFNQGLVTILKASKVDGIEINLKKLDSKHDISDFISTVRSKLGADLQIVLSVPPKADLLAKYYDFKALSKHTDLFILQTAFLGASKNVTFHPSRLSGLWDMQNTDSVVDLVGGLGAPLSKLVVTAPVQAFHFKLQSPDFTAPGSPALELKTLSRDQLCEVMSKGGNWTLERDQDQAGPYIFSKDQWIAFEDATSMDIKAKYSRVRGLAGLALKDLSQDGGAKCHSVSILESAYTGLSRQARAPRGAVLHSLEREILQTTSRPLDSVQVSPYRISRVIDVEGHVHVVRQDTRTEFQCSRQGYFVHPRSCNRFYRCVKFDQLSDEFSVFEFDCPAGLAFDERVEVCVWPGSLPHASACSGSSEIAPVPKERFICPGEPGYYPDPENCRWFFACLDHGKSPLSAYEFRCPFGLVFDEGRLVCEWPWLVPRCANGLGIGLASEVYYGGASSSSSVALEQYNGLGSLGTVKLGGLSGTIHQPVAKVYSNVGLEAGSGYLNQGAVGQAGSQYYLNQGAVGVNGLSYKAEQSLKTAGLLKESLNSGEYFDGSQEGYYNANGGVLQFGVQIVDGNFNGQYSGANLNQYSGANLVNQYSGASLNQYAQANSGASLNQYSGVNLNQQYSGGSLNQYAGANLNQYAQSNLNQYSASNLNQYSGANLNTVFSSGVNLQDQYANQNLNENYAANVNALQYQTNLENAHNYGAKSSQSFVQYHDKNEGYVGGYQNQGNLNIVGSGYSAVKATGVEVLNNGENIEAISHVTPASVSVSTVASIPTVTSVPIPSINAAFGSYNGGVIANVPELQYKIQQPSGFVTSTPASINYNLVQGSQDQGYVYNKPKVAFEEGVSVSYSSTPSSTVKPILLQQNNLVNVQSKLDLVEKSVQPTSSYFYEKQSNNGYVYDKPAVAFEDGIKTVDFAQNQAGAISTSYHQQQYNQNGGYVYEKPSVAFEEGPKIAVAPIVQQKVPIVSNYNSYHEVKSEGYNYPKPAIAFEEQPKVYVSTPAPFVHQKIVQPAVSSYNLQQVVSTGGYDYPKPAVAFEERPQVYVSSTVAPIVEKKILEPAVSSYGKTEGYSYPKPSIAFEERPAVSTYHYQQPVVTTYERTEIRKPIEQPLISTYTYQKPLVQKTIVEQPVVYQKPVTSYTYQNVLQKSVGYSYPKPEIAFEEKPIVSTYNYITPSTTPKPQVYVQQQQPQIYNYAPAVVSSYNYVAPSTPKPQVYLQNKGYLPPPKTPKTQIFLQPQPQISYNYVAPTTEKPVYVKPPAIVSSYNYVAPKQEIYVQPKPVATYNYVRPKPEVYVQSEVVVKQPAVVSSYSYVAPKPTPQVYIEQPKVVPVQQPAIVSSYNYLPPKPTPQVYVEQPKVVPVQQPAVISSYNYLPPKPTPQVYIEQPKVVPVQQPAIVSSYNYLPPKPTQQIYLEQPKIVQKPAVISSYNYLPPKPTPQVYIQPQVVAVKKPAVVSSYSYIAPSTPKPQIFVQPKLVQPATYNYVAPTTQKVYVEPISYDYVSTTRKPIGYSYPKPSVTFVEEPQPILTNYEQRQPVAEEVFVKQHAYVTGKPVVVENYQAPIQYTTPRRTYTSTVASVIAAKAPQDFYIYDSRLTSTLRPILQTYSTPRVYVSTTPKPVVVSTTLPSREYLPTREYLPAKPRVRVATTSAPIIVTKKIVEAYIAPEVTTPSREYLPVRSKATKTIIEVTSRRPVKVVKVVRPRVKTIVKQNDFHPLLSAKLGAQCTCVSNNLKLRKKPIKIIVEEEDDEDYDEDEYEVSNENPVVVEEYNYEPQKTIAITPTPNVVIKGTTLLAAPTTPYSVKKRVRVYTSSPPVTEAAELFIRKSPRDEEPSDGEIVKAVRTGLKLVKQAAKDGAVEALGGKNFDRYGPGGVRSRNERLQGTVDCQRAGLFRHPTQCNKFYACRWDCTKNKFTLHVFNCPVHLTFDNSLGACNWPSQGPACLENTLLPSE